MVLNSMPTALESDQRHLHLAIGLRCPPIYSHQCPRSVSIEYSLSCKKSSHINQSIDTVVKKFWKSTIINQAGRHCCGQISRLDLASARAKGALGWRPMKTLRRLHCPKPTMALMLSPLLYLHVQKSILLCPFFQRELGQAMRTLGTLVESRLETGLEEEILLRHLRPGLPSQSRNKFRT